MNKNKKNTPDASNSIVSELPAFFMGLLYFALIVGLSLYVIAAE